MTIYLDSVSPHEIVVSEDARSPPKRVIRTEVGVSEDGSSCIVKAGYNIGPDARICIPFQILSQYLHKLKAAAGQMVNRQRLYDLHHGIEALKSLAQAPLRVAAFAVTADRLKSEFTITLQFQDMAPLAIVLQATMAKDLNTEILQALLNAMN